MSAQFTSVGVVGLGTMGSGIAETLAASGYEVHGVDQDVETAGAGRTRIEASTSRSAAAGRYTAEQRTSLLDRLHLGTDQTQLSQCELVIDATPDDLESKHALFADLERVCTPSAILATNSGVRSVTEIAATCANPERIIGLHFFNPAPVMQLVEVVGSVMTALHVIEAATSLVETLGKQAVLIGDRVGYIAHELLFPYLNQAAALYEDGHASAEDIDAAMRLGCGLPMGPLRLLDLIGLDTASAVLKQIHDKTGLQRHAPRPILKQMSTAGRLGRKSGHGFYSYDADEQHEATHNAQANTAPSRPVTAVGIVGSGTMACGIIEVFAKAGYETHFLARGDKKIAGAKAAVQKSVDRAVTRGKLSEAAAADTMARIHGSKTMDSLANVDLVVEAVAEDLAVKKAIFRTLDTVCKPSAVLATTTSSLHVVSIATATSRPQDVVGMHFFNPAAVMRLVEVVSTVLTTPDVTQSVVDVAVRLGKHPVRCKDRSGFIVNMLLFPYLNDAIRLVETHYASVDQVDAVMKAGCGFPMGPFELLDVVGNDVSLTILEELEREFYEPSFSPSPLLRYLVTAGRLGRKTGHGFRTY